MDMLLGNGQQISSFELPLIIYDYCCKENAPETGLFFTR